MRSLVDVVLELDELSTDYHVEFDPDEALEFVRRAVAYNRFTTEDLEKLVKRINDLIPPTKFPQPNNPNNGRLHHKFIIGNEGSRVIYLKISKFYLKEEFQGFKTDYEGLVGQLKVIGEAAKADECLVVQNNDGYFIYRFWWD